MSETRKIAKNTAFSALSLIMRLVSNAVLVLVIARRLGVDRYGQFAFALAFAHMFSMFADFGLDVLVVKEVAQNPRDFSKLANNTLSLKAVLSVVTVLAAAIVINVLKYSTDVKLLVYIAVLSAVIFELVMYLTALLRSVERMKYESVISLIYNAVLILGILPVLHLFSSPIYVMLTYLAVRVLVLLIAEIIVSKAIFPIHLSYNLNVWKWLLKETVPYGLFGITALVYFQSDTILLSYFKGDKPVGLYQAAVSIILAVMYFAEMMLNSFLPVLSRYFSQSKEMFLKGTRNFLYILLFVGIPATVFTFVLATKIIILLYGEHFASSGMVLRWTSFLIVLRFSAVAYGTVLTVSSNQNIRTRAAIITAGVNIVLGLLLIPRCGIGGAISTVMFSYTLLNVQYARGAYKITRSFLMDGDILIISIVALMLGGVCYYFANVNVIILFVLYSVLYVAILYVMPKSKVRIMLNKFKEHQL